MQTMDHLDVSVSPDSVIAGDSTYVTVIAKDSNNSEIQIPDCVPVSFHLEYLDGSAGDYPLYYGYYGILVAPDGRTGTTIGVNVAYGDARSGKIKFVANGQWAGRAPLLKIVGRTGGGYFSRGETPLEIIPPLPDHFYVYTGQDTVEHADRIKSNLLCKIMEDNYTAS